MALRRAAGVGVAIGVGVATGFGSATGAAPGGGVATGVGAVGAEDPVFAGWWSMVVLGPEAPVLAAKRVTWPFSEWSSCASFATAWCRPCVAASVGELAVAAAVRWAVLSW